MTSRIRKLTVHGLLALSSSLLLACVLAVGPSQASLSPSAFGVSAVCPAPAPMHASCLAMKLVPRSPLSMPGAHALPRVARAAARASSPATETTKPVPGSLTPALLLSAYNLSGVAAPASTQTIGVVDAYDDATVEADLAHFDSQYGLAACTQASGCLRKVNQEGSPSPLPASKGSAERGWAQEIATDVETVHAICGSCHILLVEARSSQYSDLFAAESTAAGLGATEITNSWGGEELEGDSPAFNHPGVVITASAGDNGYLNWLGESESRFTDYPASSPHVVAVGGTRLKTSPSGVWQGETVWNDGGTKGVEREGYGAGGGGCSELFSAPTWQPSVAVGCAGKRAVADVAADADPYSGVAVYDSTTNPEGNRGWAVIGGTSVASPIIASIFALAGGAHGVPYPARTLYENASSAATSVHDVTEGSNGECLKPFEASTGTSGCSTAEDGASCSSKAICVSRAGYDGPTGVGTPDGIAAFAPSPEVEALREASERASEEARRSGERSSTSSSAPVAAPVTPAPTPSAPAAGAPPSAQISALTLTLRALFALNSSRPRVAQVAFAFTVNVSARVRVTLAHRVHVHRHTRWQLLRNVLTITARSGRNSQRLGGAGVLSPGLYRLTATLANGTARSIVFQIG